MSDDGAHLDVLLVDPSGTLEQVERALYAVDDAVTVDSVDAVDAIDGHDPDAVVVSHDERFDGRKRTAMIRVRLPETPVIVVATDPDPEFVTAAFDEGAADVVSVLPVIRVDEDMPNAITRRIRCAAGKGGEFASDTELLDSLMEYLPHQVFIKDDHGRIAEASAVAAEEYGLRRDQMIGLTDQELFAPEYAADLWAEETEIMATEEPVINRTEHYTDEQGHDRWINVTKAPRYDSDGEVVGIIGTAVDVTDQKRQERMVNALHAASRDLVSAQSREKIAEVAVDIAEDIPDLPVVQVSLVEDGSATPVYSGGDTHQSAVFEGQEEWFQRAFDTGESQFIHVPADGSSLHVRTRDDLDDVAVFAPHVVTIPLGEHGVLGFGATGDALDEFGIDLADVLAANVETALSRMTHEEALRARERDLAAQNERLEEFAGIVSHDIRNPLSVAKGYLPQTDADEGIKTEISRSLDRMDHLTDELLTLARKGQIVGETAAVRLDEAARAAWRNVSASDDDLDVRSNAAIDADRERLVELLENLFRNAVVHASPDDRPASVTITVGTTADGFYIEDDGQGIPDDEKDVVFEWGYTTHEDGTGFGLRIVEVLANAHDWEVDLVDSESGGVRFEIRGV